jgi:ubiquinone/menaquinone biosynthesis C-methylase UbiE/alpha-beta hydrolase superfamily lysophospholipase
MARTIPSIPEYTMNEEGLEDNKTGNLGESAVEGIRRSFFTKRLEFVNRAGKKIVVHLDIPLDKTLPLGVVLIAPAYGETKENNLLISAYFVSNGFHSLRFDWADHVGESEGDVFTSTLSKMRDDILGLLDHVKERYPSAKTGLLATSLAARVALKIAASDPRVDFLVCCAPVVNLRETLNMVYREDLVGNYSRGKRYGTLDILGFCIDADRFLGDAIERSFSDLLSAREDAIKITVPTFFLAGDKDRWVRIDDARSVFQAIDTSQKRFFLSPSTLHRLMENPTATMDALKNAVGCILDHVSGQESGQEMDVEDVRDPDLDEIRTHEAREKARLKEIYKFSKTEERHFWKRYLSNFQYIINIHDYWNLLELIYGLLGGAWPGQRILDAGCGNGTYGLFLLSKQMYKVHQDFRYLSMPPISYFGADFVWDAIAEATGKINKLQEGFRKRVGLTHQQPSFMDTKLTLADLEEKLPFPDNFFDQVCCNLVVSYLQEPMKALHELCRVLRPSGRMVISSLKPNADLSEIYRNFISTAESNDEIEEARKLLSNSGKIKLKGVRGIYRFYTEKELKQMVRDVGLSRTKTFRSFGDQANIVLCHKRQ